MLACLTASAGLQLGLIVVGYTFSTDAAAKMSGAPVQLRHNDEFDFVGSIGRTPLCSYARWWMVPLRRGGGADSPGFDLSEPVRPRPPAISVIYAAPAGMWLDKLFFVNEYWFGWPWRCAAMSYGPEGFTRGTSNASSKATWPTFVYGPGLAEDLGVGMLITCVPLVGFKRVRRAMRRRRGLCLACGYDLRGAGGVCPECGAGET